MSKRSKQQLRGTEYGASIRILLGNDIERAVQSRLLIITPFDSKAIQPTSYDFAVDKLIGDSEEFFDLDLLGLKGGESILLLSFEYFEFPSNMIAHIWLRSSFARKLRMSSALGRIEAGWRGHLVLEIINNGNSPVEIKKGDRLATLEIYMLDRPSPHPYSGRYQDYGVEVRHVAPGRIYGTPRTRSTVRSKK